MVNITHKSTTLRKAIATAIVRTSRQETIDAILNKRIPKGDVFEFSRAAGLLGIKKTSDLIPDCHPLPVEYASIRHRVDGLDIIIEVEVHTIYRTGVEVEAMHGASITALTMYDMLKPVDTEIEICSIRLVRKEGGKSGTNKDAGRDLTAAIIVCSDSISKGEGVDTAGVIAKEKLQQYGMEISTYEIISDDIDLIRSKAEVLSAGGTDLLLFAGGTGISPRDVTPDAIAPLIDKTVPGIMEAFRQYGQERMPFAMLSRGVAGFIKDSLVITLPGSANAVSEGMDALFPHILHVFKIRAGYRHDDVS